MHAAYVLQAGDLQPFPRIISDESGERQCINIRGKRLRDVPPVAPKVLPLVSTKYRQPQRVGVSGAAAASDNHDHHGIGRWVLESHPRPRGLILRIWRTDPKGHRAQSVVLNSVTCDPPWQDSQVSLDRPTPPWVGAHLGEAELSVMSGPCRWGARQGLLYSSLDACRICPPHYSVGKVRAAGLVSGLPPWAICPSSWRRR